jgi:hypothetical protein
MPRSSFSAGKIRNRSDWDVGRAQALAIEGIYKQRITKKEIEIPFGMAPLSREAAR